MGKGNMAPPMSGGMGAMPDASSIFGGMPPPAGGDVADADLDAMFAEDEMGGGDQQTKLMDSLIGAGFSPTPEQVTQIMDILQSGGKMPEGVEPTEAGMEAMV